MIAVGNREGGYGQNELEALQAFAPVVVEVFLRKKAEVALKERKVRLMRAEEMAHLGHWRYDLATEAFSWSDEMYRIFGLSREDGLYGPTTEQIRKCCHPDDMENCAVYSSPPVSLTAASWNTGSSDPAVRSAMWFQGRGRTG